MPADDWRKKNAEFQEPKLSENLKLVDRLRQVADKHGRSPGEAAIAWTLRHPAVTGAIVGARNSQQVDGVFRAAEFTLSDDEARFIEDKCLSSGNGILRRPLCN